MSDVPSYFQMISAISGQPGAVRERERVLEGSHQQRGKRKGSQVKPKSKAVPLTGINDSKVSNLKWNTLPGIGETLHDRKHSMNVTITDSKLVAYDPRYNPMLNKFDTFIQFNEQCPLMDVVTMAPKRLESFVRFLNYYYECKKFMTDSRKHKEMTRFPGEIDGLNFLEMEHLSQLWYLQSIRFLLNNKSLIFTSSLVNWLLQRRQKLKHEEIDESSLDADVLVVRANASDSMWAWQVAYDEPSLNVVDYVLDISVFSKNGKNSGLNELSPNKMMVKDVMGRSARHVESLYEDDKNASLSEEPNQSDSDSSVFTADVPAKDLLPTKSAPGGSNKLMKAAHVGTSGIAHLFKKKTAASLTAASRSTESILNDGSHSPPTSFDGNTLTLKNRWLEDHYSKRLSNFTSVHVQPYFEPFTSIASEIDVDQDKMQDYKLLYLKIKLPFKDSTIPSIFCPNLWFHLRFDKWKNVLEEFYRSLAPGGSLHTENLDFKGSSIDADNQCSHATTAELRKILDAAALEAMKENIQIYPMRHLVYMLNEVGFVNVKCCVLSLKRGDLCNELGCLYEFMSMFQYDFIVKKFLPDPSLYPEGTHPPTFPLRYFKERFNTVDSHLGSLRMVCITAEKPSK